MHKSKINSYKRSVKKRPLPGKTGEAGRFRDDFYFYKLYFYKLFLEYTGYLQTFDVPKKMSASMPGPTWAPMIGPMGTVRIFWT